MKHKIIEDNYLKASKIDKESAKEYFTKSIVKTEQQKFLEYLLSDAKEIDFNARYKIADLACGGGTLSYHLSNIFPNAEFYLMDYNSDALDIAKEINKDKKLFQFIQGDLRHIPFDDNYFDLVFCWGAFLIFDEDTLQSILNEISRILKHNGKLYASSLFNTEFDVDIKCDFRDFTRSSGESGIWGRYITYSKPTITKMLASYFTFDIHPFHPKIDFPKTTHRGIGTFSETVIENNKKIQVGKNFGGALVSNETNPNIEITNGGGEN